MLEYTRIVSQSGQTQENVGKQTSGTPYSALRSIQTITNSVPSSSALR